MITEIIKEEINVEYDKIPTVGLKNQSKINNASIETDKHLLYN